MKKNKTKGALVQYPVLAAPLKRKNGILINTGQKGKNGKK